MKLKYALKTIDQFGSVTFCKVKPYSRRIDVLVII